MKLYIKTSRDDYELPEAVAESVCELSMMTGCTEHSIRTMLTRKQRGWIVIDVPSDYENEI